MNKAKMTFRFEEPPRKKLDATPKEQIHFKPIEGKKEAFSNTDFGAWEPTFEDETYRIEQLIRGTDRPDREPANRLKPSADKEVFVIKEEQPNESEKDIHVPIYEESIVHNYYRKSRNPSWIKVFATVTGAIVTGAIFGFVVLSLFKGDLQLPGTKTSPLSDDIRTSAGVQSGEGTANKGRDAGTGKAVGTTGANASGTMTLFSADIHIPKQTYSMLQYGVFSNMAGVKQAEQELEAKGLAAFADTSDLNRVYAGVASTKEDAMLLSQQFKTEGIELYVRDVETPEIKQLAYNGDADTAGKFFTQSNSVIQMLIRLSVEHLQLPKDSPFSQSDIQALKDAHQGWTELENKAAAGIPEQARKSWTKMTQAMNTAIVSLNEYNKKVSKAHLWGIQSAVMDYIMAEKTLLETIGT